jgi:tetratricopeptide (TPR) repeat protein
MINAMNDRIPLPQPSFLDRLNINLTLPELKVKYSRLYRQRYLAVIQCFTYFHLYPEPVDRLDYVKGYLDAFYHLIEIEDWERALRILIEPLSQHSTLEEQDLLGQLQVWSYYQKAIELSEQIVEHVDPHHRLLITTRIANAYESLGMYELAEQNHESCLGLARELGQFKIAVNSLNHLGNIYLLLQKHEQAIGFYEAAWKIAEEIDDDRQKMTILGNVGNLLMSVGDNIKAIEFLEKAIDISRKNDDRLAEGLGLGNLGTCYNKLGEYRSAETNLLSALAIYREFGDRQGELSVLVNLGNNYSGQNDNLSAIEYHQQGLEIAREIEDKINEFHAITGLGNAHYFLEEYSQAETYFQQSRSIADLIDYPLGSALAMANIGSNAAKLNQSDLAIAKLTTAIELLQQLQAFELAATVADRLAEIHDRAAVENLPYKCENLRE